MIKRAAILLAAITVIASIVLLFAYDVLKLEFIGFMEIQPSFRPMEEPLPIPAQSVPIEGAAYIAGLGAPENPIEADEVSIERGKLLYAVNCALCHGEEGGGNGPIGPFLVNKKPANLQLDVTQSKSDGTIFIIITNGIPEAMPALNQNLTVRERWDVVNYLRTIVP